MPDDSFIHDESTFHAADEPSGDDLSDVEARYADLVAEVIWDGVITAESRKRLSTAREMFGLDAERAEQIEKALTAAHESIHQVAVVEEQQRVPKTTAPFARSQDPRLKALQRRIAVVERSNEELVREKRRLQEHNDKLEALVAQLQDVLESTLEELDEAYARLDGKPVARVPDDSDTDGPVSRIRSTSDAPPDLDALDRAVVLGREMADKRRLLKGALKAPRASAPSRGNPEEIHRLVQLQPRDPKLLRALWASLGRSDDADRRWGVAQALSVLGEADDEQQSLLDRLAGDGLVRPSRAVNDDEWTELLYHPDQSVLIGQILAEIAPAVVLGQLTALRRDGRRAEDLEPGERIDPGDTEITAARCFAWAAAALGVRTPQMFAVPDNPRMVRMVLNPRPSIRLGKDALADRSPAELAFIAGRHVTWYRKEHLLGKAAGSGTRLEEFFLAALAIGNPGLPLTADVKQRVEPIARAIAPLLNEAAVGQLQHYFALFVEQGGRTSLAKWLKAADKTAARTGLLLSNSLQAAETILKIEDPAKLDERLDELIFFITSERYSRLRRQLGIRQSAAGSRT